MVFSGLGGQIAQAWIGQAKSDKTRKFLAIIHGVGLTVIFVAGFGLLAKIKAGFPLWVILKLVIWLILGAAGAIAARKQHLAAQMWVFVLLLGTLAAYLAGYKPF